MRTRKLGFGICVWFLFTIETCLCRFVVENISLKVTSPEKLKSSYECALANFGIPMYGGTLRGLVIYPKENQNACNSFTDDISFKRNKPGDLPIFLLADRGGCFFSDKSWNAQNAGAAAIIIANEKEELITMDSPEHELNATYLQNLTIPSVFIRNALGVSIKEALEDVVPVLVTLDWIEALPHPDDRVEYEFWTNSNDECGLKCDNQLDFVKNFRPFAHMLEQQGHTRFTPHYITWYCPVEYTSSDKCKSQCIHHGKYCVPDPEGDFSKGYTGKEVVVQNLYQACFFKVANESGKPWLWWDYVTDFSTRCGMKDHKYNKECAREVITSFGVDANKVDTCVGDTEADNEDTVNEVLQAEQHAQIGNRIRGDVTMQPTLVINNRQYRGRLDNKAVLKAICSGFKETTEPALCLSNEIETNDCLIANGGCWMDRFANITACKDTFRGKVCECPIVNGVKFVGDGYTYCEAPRCLVNNGGCWESSKEGRNYTACIDDHTEGCACPSGFKGDGVKSCEDIDECKEKKACQCSKCKCKNTFGSYECSCPDNLVYLREHDICISTKDVKTRDGWGFGWVFVGLIAIGVVGYIFYKYRVRRYMDSEIRAIMAQYMPLDDEVEAPLTRPHGNIQT